MLCLAMKPIKMLLLKMRTLTVGHPKDGVNAKNWNMVYLGVCECCVGDELTAGLGIDDESLRVKTVQENGVEQIILLVMMQILSHLTVSIDFEDVADDGNRP